MADVAELLRLHGDALTALTHVSAQLTELEDEREHRERFVATLAHDLRGPMMVARFSCEMLTFQLDPADERRQLCNRVVAALKRADRMICDLLDYSQVRLGRRLPLSLAPCAIGPLVRRVANELAELHGSHRFLVIADDLTKGVWCADQLHRAIWNLLRNALQHGDAVTPILVTVEENDFGIALSVRNSGPAIPAEELPALFDPFQRGHDAKAKGPRSWGLGLALVRTSAEAHGGHVNVVSDATATIFTLHLPLDASRFQNPSSPVELPAL